MRPRTRVLILGLLVCLGFFLYAFNLHNGLFWDDDDWIVNNPMVHALSWDHLTFIFSHDTLAGIGLTSNYYRPFLFVTFLFNYLVGGINPFGYHLVSNLLHVGNAVLLFLLLNRMFRTSDVRTRVPFLASLLFLIHPLQTEAVTYVSGRGDPLSMFLMLSTLYAFLQKQNWLSYGLAIIAVLSRETAFLFPLYLTVFMMAFIHREKFWQSWSASIKKALPYLGISVVYGILRLTVLNFQNTLNFYHQSNVYTQHLLYRIYTFFHALAVYIKLIFIPTGLHMERDIAVNTSLFQWPVWISALALGVLGWWLRRLYVKEQTIQNDGDIVSDFRIWWFGAGWFFINLAPTSGIFPINALIYEHWLYFSLAGFFTVAAFQLARVFQALRSRTGLQAAAIVIAVAYCGFLGTQTIRRNIVWGKIEEFYRQILAYEPENVRVLNNLANWYSDHGRQAEAEPLLWKAIDADDVQPAPYYNLANILRDRKDYAGALELYRKAVMADPTFPYAYTTIAAIYAEQGNLTEAARYLESLKQVQPGNFEVYYNLGLVYQALGRYTEARRIFQQGLSLTGDPRIQELFNQKINDIPSR